jgi:hypothetical protein
MPPEHAVGFGGGASASTISPIVLAALLICVILIFMLPRKSVIWPTFIMIFLVPVGEQVVLGGVHLFAFRIVILAGLARLLWSKSSTQTEAFAGGLTLIDKLFIACGLCIAAAVTLLFLSGDAIVNQVGFLLDYLGGYFFMRYLIRDEEDIYRAIKCLGVLAFIIGLCMLRELYTLQNIFASIGGQIAPEIREGRVRSAGPFSHELMAGAYGATLFPLLVLLWKSKYAKVAAMFGVIGSVLMTWTSNSSTSLLAFAAGLLAIAFWPIRKSMRAVRWGIVGGLIALQLVMKAPIWFFIAHIDLTGGSSSYHRAELIDLFIHHFTEWCLIGTKQTGSWGWDMWDAQNQFVNVGTTGGIVALTLFIAMISVAFSRLGNSRKAVEGDTKKEWLYWLLGATLFSHIVAFFGVNYFDQSKFTWYLILAMISAATVSVAQTSEAPEKRPRLGYRNPRLAYSRPRKIAPATTKQGQKVPVQLKSRITN